MIRPAYLAICLILTAIPLAARAAETPPDEPCRVVADRRVEQPLRTIVDEYVRRTGVRVDLEMRDAADLHSMLRTKQPKGDLLVVMTDTPDENKALEGLDHAKKVAWKHPGDQPVWAVVLGKHPRAAELAEFLGGPTGHRLWSESPAGFTIVSGDSHAKAFEWVVENRVRATYPMTAMRILGELGGIRKGICIDIGCGTGNLDIELAKRSELKIIGLDIDPDMQPLFEKRIREAGLEDRISFVEGDAQKLPFPDDYADAIVSRGTLTFIPDIAKCLQEVDRVLKPSGVAFLGGRYLYTPQAYKKSNDQLREIVRRSGVPGATVIDQRGQWVKIVGPKAPKAAASSGLGPQLLAPRLVADYGITKGRCLLVLSGDGPLQQTVRKDLARLTQLQITALYPTEKLADEAKARIEKEGLADRIDCKVGDLEALPLADASVDLLAGIGPVLIWGDRQKKMTEIERVLREGGAALVGGRYLGMPKFRRVSSETLRADAQATGIPSIRIIDDMGQWVEVLKGVAGH